MEPPRGADIRRDRERLRGVRGPLLKLHKALLEAERIAYEKEHGRIANPGAFLQLLMSDPWFAWLRPLSGLIVLIDEHLEAEEPQAPAAGAQLLEQARALSRPDGRQQVLIQAHPDVALAQRDVSRALEVPVEGN